MHHDSPINSRTLGFPIHRSHTRRGKEWRSGRRRPTNLPQVEVPCLALEGVGAGEEEGGGAGEVVAGDEDGFDGVTEGEGGAVGADEILF